MVLTDQIIISTNLAHSNMLQIKYYYSYLFSRPKNYIIPHSYHVFHHPYVYFSAETQALLMHRNLHDFIQRHRLQVG